MTNTDLYGDPDMSWGFANTADPNISPETTEVFPAGPHVVKGIYSWITKDDTGPFYKERQGASVVMFRLMLEDGSEGPPMSAEAWKIVLMVRAFGGDVSKLPRNRMTPAFLDAAMEEINAQQKPVKVSVNDNGWTGWVEGCDLPTDQAFRYKVVRWASPDGKELHFAKKNEEWDGEFVYMYLEVVGDMLGNKTPYDGARVRVDVEQPFEGVREVEDEMGTYLAPDARRAQNGGQRISVSRIIQILRAFWPEVRNYRWESNPAHSNYSVNEAEQPIVVIADRTVNGGRVCVGMFQPNRKGRMVLEPLTFTPLDQLPQQKSVVVEEAEGNEALDTLCEWLNAECEAQKGTKAFVKGFTLSAEGKDLCRELLKPIWAAHPDLFPPGFNNLKLMTAEQAQFTLNALTNAVDESAF